MPAAQGTRFGLEEQEDPGAEQRQVVLTIHGTGRMLSLASLKSLKCGKRGGGVFITTLTGAAQPGDTGDKQGRKNSSSPSPDNETPEREENG